MQLRTERRDRGGPGPWPPPLWTSRAVRSIAAPMADAAQGLEIHRPLVQALAYRMLGSAADAEDVVQDTFLRALTHPPEMDRPVRPWLLRVACNLAKDRLRRRKVRDYHGPWLPEPMAEPPTDASADPEVRLRLAQTATLAWLTAAEVLTPEQRAVFLLREVMDWEVDEVAETLGRSPGSVRSLHLRARRALGAASLPSPEPKVLQAHREALARLLQALLQQDTAALEELLAPEVVLHSDGGGEVHAVGKQLYGAARVAKVAVALVRASAETLELRVERVNGMPAVIERTRAHRSARWPTTSLTSVVLGPDGRVTHIFNIVAPSKLTRIGLEPR